MAAFAASEGVQRRGLPKRTPRAFAWASAAFDLSYVEWMDSSALTALVTAFQRTGRARGSFAVRALHDRVRPLFVRTRLDRVMPINEPTHAADRLVRTEPFTSQKIRRKLVERSRALWALQALRAKRPSPKCYRPDHLPAERSRAL